MSQDEVMVVFTDESVEQVLENGGTAAWRFQPRRASRCKYVLCTRNVNGNGVTGPEEHRAGFLMGKVERVVPMKTTRDGVRRFLVKFSEYAHVDIPDAWHKGNQNPVAYSSLEAKGIEPSMLDWRSMPQPTNGDSKPELTPRVAVIALSLQQAKAGLALTFGVEPEAIEITIRA